MKKILIGMIISVCGFTPMAFCQLGLLQSLPAIRSTHPGGIIRENPSGGYVYNYDSADMKSGFIYLLNERFNCYTTIVKPEPQVLGYWKKSLDEDWIRTGRNKWKLCRPDGIVVQCELMKDASKAHFLIAKVKY